ncbi:MAG: PIN domain-containing protein [Thermoanaerobaculia bacterium]
MIYLDTSVALAQLLAEDRQPPEELWAETIVSSRLLEYELWNAIHRHGLMASHAEAARQLLEALAFAELSRETLRRALEPFPVPVRTLEALHLASVLFLRDQGLELELASYDGRMIEAATALGIPLAEC